MSINILAVKGTHKQVEQPAHRREVTFEEMGAQDAQDLIEANPGIHGHRVYKALGVEWDDLGSTVVGVEKRLGCDVVSAYQYSAGISSVIHPQSAQEVSA